MHTSLLSFRSFLKSLVYFNVGTCFGRNGQVDQPTGLSISLLWQEWASRSTHRFEYQQDRNLYTAWQSNSAIDKVSFKISSRNLAQDGNDFLLSRTLLLQQKTNSLPKPALFTSVQ